MELIVERDIRTYTAMYFLKTESFGKDVFIGLKDGQLFEQTIDHTINQPLIPLFELDIRTSNIFLACMANYLSNQGMKTENENLLLGKLAATEKHLDDLRNMTFRLLDSVLINKVS